MLTLTPQFPVSSLKFSTVTRGECKASCSVHVRFPISIMEVCEIAFKEKEFVLVTLLLLWRQTTCSEKVNESYEFMNFCLLICEEGTLLLSICLHSFNVRWGKS